MRLRLAVVGAAFVVTTACVPPPPKDLSNNFVVSYAGPSVIGSAPGSAVMGTVTNTGMTPADYSVGVVASSGQTASYDALDVLAGQTAIWFIGLSGDVTVAQTTVTSSATIASPVPAVATITQFHEQRLVTVVEERLLTVVEGTVTNTGGSTASFEIDCKRTQVSWLSPRLATCSQAKPWGGQESSSGGGRLGSSGSPRSIHLHPRRRDSIGS